MFHIKSIVWANLIQEKKWAVWLVAYVNFDSVSSSRVFGLESPTVSHTTLASVCQNKPYVTSPWRSPPYDKAQWMHYWFFIKHQADINNHNCIQPLAFIIQIQTSAYVETKIFINNIFVFSLFLNNQ